MTKHPLIGRYLVWDEPAREFWTLGRFKVQLNTEMFLVEQLKPADGQPALGGDVVVHLGQLVIGDDERTLPRAQVFDDFAAVQGYIAEMDKPAAEKVVKLVKP